MDEIEKESQIVKREKTKQIEIKRVGGKD